MGYRKDWEKEAQKLKGKSETVWSQKNLWEKRNRDRVERDRERKSL